MARKQRPREPGKKGTEEASIHQLPPVEISNARCLVPKSLSPSIPVPRSLSQINRPSLCIKFAVTVTREPWRESNKRMLYSTSRLPCEARSRRPSHLLYPRKQNRLSGDLGLLYG